MIENPERWFDDRVVVVTGASRGIGKAIAKDFAARGAALVITGVSEDRLACVASELRESGAKIRARPGDLADPDFADELVADAVDSFDRVDVVVNNAFWEASAPIKDIDLEDWDRTLRVSLSSAMLTTKAVIPHMLRQSGGAIVNISSQRALASGHGMAAYESAKAGLMALTRSTAVDYGQFGVRCNCVSPGLVLTERIQEWYNGAPWRKQAMNAVIPLGRPGYPEEVAAVVTFVAGPLAAYVNGAVIPVDGGALSGLPENAALSLTEDKRERPR